MGSINYGNQTITFDYNQDAKGSDFNQYNFQIVPTGIYNGFTLAKLSNIAVSVSAGSCFIEDSTYKTGVRVETVESQLISISNATPYIVLRFQWADATNNFMDILAVSYADIESDDLIVGRVIYETDGITMKSNIDYSRRTLFYTNKQRTQKDYLKVLPTEPPSNQFVITSGVLNTPKGNIAISGGTFPIGGLENTTNGRNDIVFIDENGDVQVEKGIDSSSPVSPRYGNKKVIAEIRRGALRSSIFGYEIVQVNTSFDSFPQSSDQLINDENNLYSSTNVEDAFQEIAGSEFVFKGLKTFNNGVSILNSETIQGASGVNIQTLKKLDGTTIQYVDQNGRLYNSVGSQIALTDTYSKYTTDRIDSALNQIAGEALTIDGIKTFSSSPIVPTLSNGTTTHQAASTKFVMDNISYLFSAENLLASINSVPVPGSNLNAEFLQGATLSSILGKIITNMRTFYISETSTITFDSNATKAILFAVGGGGGGGSVLAHTTNWGNNGNTGGATTITYEDVEVCSANGGVGGSGSRGNGVNTVGGTGGTSITGTLLINGSGGSGIIGRTTDAYGTYYMSATGGEGGHAYKYFNNWMYDMFMFYNFILNSSPTLGTGGVSSNNSNGFNATGKGGGGSGASYRKSTSEAWCAGGGGSGGCAYSIINVGTTKTFNITVGAGGTANITGQTRPGGNGSNGYAILVPLYV